MSREARVTGKGAGCPSRREAPGMSDQTWRIAASYSVGRKHASRALQWCRLAIGAGLLEPKDELHVVLDDAIGLIGFSEGGARAADFRGCVRDLVPEDRGEAFVADLPAADEDVGVEGDDLVLTEAAPRAADVADDDAEATARDEDAKALLPDLVELLEEMLVVVNMAQLPRAGQRTR